MICARRVAGAGCEKLEIELSSDADVQLWTAIG